MTTYVSTSNLLNTSNVVYVLKAYAEAGLSNVELGTGHKYTGELSPYELGQDGFNFLCHAYFPPPKKPLIVNLASSNPDILAQSKQQIRRSIDFCYSLGIDLFTFHAGFRADPSETLRFTSQQHIAPYETAFSTFVESVEEINSYAQERGVRIAVENNVLSDYNVVDGRNPFLLLCEAEEFVELWERIPSPNVGILLDLGHLKVTSHWLGFDRYQFVDKVKDRVFALHLHENNGLVDEHKGLNEDSWCLRIINEQCFAHLPLILESKKMTIDQIRQQVSMIEMFINKG